MDSFKNTTEIIEFAIRSEQEAHDFYVELAERVNNPEMKDILTKFAGEELTHKKILSDVIIKTGQTGFKHQEVDDLKMSDYLVDKQPAADMSYQDVLIIAMKKEKKAFKLYNDLATRISDENLKKVFYNLAQEEGKHKLRFEIEYDEQILKDN